MYPVFRGFVALQVEFLEELEAQSLVQRVCDLRGHETKVEAISDRELYTPFDEVGPVASSAVCWVYDEEGEIQIFFEVPSTH